MTTYQEVDARLQGRNHESRKVDNNTYLRRKGGDIVLRLHNTDIITYKPNGDIILDSGGWRTPTTKDRFNGNGISVWQEHGVWSLHMNGQEWKFEDGITIHPDGTVTGAGRFNPKADRKFKAKVRLYAQRYADRLPLESPSGGDCWFCSMVGEDGRSWGESAKDTDHLLAHMDGAGHIIPSLAYQALKKYGNARAAFWECFKESGYEGDRNFGKQAIKRAVYRYVMHQFGYAV